MPRFTLMLAATLLAGVLAAGFAVAPANAAAANIGSTLNQIQSNLGSDLTTVHCRSWYHCHGWGCHTCGAGPYRPYYRPYGYYRPYYRPYGYYRPYRYRY